MTTLITLYDFDRSFSALDGTEPLGGLAMDSAGNLFGTTAYGGTVAGSDAIFGGTVFEVTGISLFSVVIDGIAQEGQTLTADASDSVSSYQWQVLLNGNWTDIPGATAATYVVQPGDDGRQLRVQATAAAGDLATSAPTNAVLDAAGNQYVYETADRTTVGNGHFQYIFGRATNTVVNDGGEQKIDAAGTAVNTTLNTGALQIDWGTTISTTINAGTQYVYGTADQTIIGNSGTVGGIQYVESGGRATGTTVNWRGEQDVYAGAVASGTTVLGKQIVYGSAEHTNVGDGPPGGEQDVYGTATDTTLTVSKQIVYQGGTATGTTLTGITFIGIIPKPVGFVLYPIGSTQFVWGTAVNTNMSFASHQYVYGTAINTTLNTYTGPANVAYDHGGQYVETGGTATGTTINSGCQQTVYAGGSASSTMVAGGSQSVYGSADQTEIGAGGLQYIHGSATNTTVDAGGAQNIYSEGTAAGTTLNAGGNQVDWGMAADTTINGGNQYVWGTAAHTMINAGIQFVEAGGSASDSTIESGGTEYVFAGGTANGVTFGGANAILALAQGSNFTGTIAGFQSGDTIDLGGIQFGDSTTLGYSENSDHSGGSLTVSDGTHAVALALLGQYMASSFVLSSDGHGGVSLTDNAVQAQNILAASLG